MPSNASDLLGTFDNLGKLTPEQLAGLEGLDSDFLAGGGSAQADFLLNFFTATEDATRGRAAGGLDLLKALIDLQRDPSNLAAALQLQAITGGNAATAAASRGGAISENPNASIIQQLIGGTAEFALGEGNVETSGATSSAQAKHNTLVAGGTNKTPQPSQNPLDFFPESGEVTSAGNEALAAALAPAISESVVTTPSIEREGLPPNVQAAIKQFEKGQGSTTSVMQSIANGQMKAQLAANTAKRSAETQAPIITPKTPGQRLNDPNTLEGGSSLTSPQLVEQTIRNAIGKRQTKKGARNQVLASAVGRAGAGATN